MCTNIDHDATKKVKDALKKTGTGHAWKIIRILDNKWVPPFRYLSCHIPYNKSGVNLASGIFYDPSHLLVAGGAFHCCLTRKIARQIVKQQDEIWSFKVVKVIFDEKDFVCVGNMNRIDQDNWRLPYENDSICVKKFKFAEK